MNRMVWSVIAAAAAWLMIAAGAWGQAGHEYKELQLASGRVLRYAIVAPEKPDPNASYPVLLALPPGNQDERMVEADLAQYWEDEATRRGWVVVSPVASAEQSLFHDTEAVIGALMDHIAGQLSVEGGKFHIAGASNGGRLAFRAATLLPERTASVVVLPGYPPQRIDMERLGKLKGKPVTLFVGENDRAWRDESERTHRQLVQLGAKANLEVLAGQDHVLHIDSARLFDVLDAARSRQSPQEAAAAATLDALHAAAAAADFDAYFANFAENGVFLGTDASERWTVEEFKVYTRARFDRGQGWSYTPLKRHITFSQSGEIAWFDELLDNARLGTCRGTGVLVQEDGAWKVAQYNLTMTVPNEVAERVARVIRGR